MENQTTNETKTKRYLKNSVMSIQHLFAMMGATILVPILCNMSISIALISAGTGTIIFFFITKKKVPVFLGSSFAFLGALRTQLPAAEDALIGSHVWNVAMAQMAIAIVCTGLVYVILSLLVKCLGTKFIKKLFPPIVVGPVIIVIGMNLAGTAIDGIVAGDGASTYMTIAYLVTGLLATGTIIFFAVFMKGFFKVIPILMGLIVGYISALCFGLIDFSLVASSGWIIFQPSEFTKAFGWYSILFTSEVWSGVLPVILAFVPIAIVTFMEHLGDINASSVVCGQDFISDPGVHRTLLGDGVATIAAGFLGGPCNTTYGENTAVLAITKNYDPKNLVLAGIFAIALGIFSKFGALIGTIPWPVIGGASLVLYGMIAANGLKTLIESKVDFSDSRNLIVCSLILVIGIGMNSIGVTLNIGSVSFTGLSVATFVGIALNAIFLAVKGKQESGLSGTYSNLDMGGETKDETQNETQEVTE